MALKTGDRLGAYEIVGLLGHGAMGEVYRARDTRLGRDVAVKVLPAAFANDADRLGRLEREARLISQVNHPNICTLFDIVEGPNAPFLILELIEGETLQQRLLRGPMPRREALRCASGIAAALEAAHGKGIIHRDLKPSNIKITAAGTIKVLDFGVAKLARDSGSDLGVPDLTLTLGGTKEGVLVGTVAYVSPEQAMGDRVDERSDIWAFGCLLYEMLTATRAFPGVAMADTLGAVMRGEPDWTALPGDTPTELRTLLRRCLEKDRGRRIAHIADARLEIEDLLAGRSDSAPRLAGSANNTAVPSRPRRRLTVALAFLAGVVLASTMAREAYNRQAEAEPPVVESRGNTPVAPNVEIPPPTSPAVPSRESTAEDSGRNPSLSSTPAPASEPVPAFISLPDGMTWARAVNGGVPNTIVAISPDGRLVVYSGRAGDVTALWLRSFVLNDAWPLPGTEGGVSPFWSPDSGSIGFFADRQLKRLDLNGLGTRGRESRQLAVPVTLAEVRSQRGGTWGPDGTIVFSPASGGLKRISANGGAVTSLTSPDPDEPAHFRPHFFAGTRHLLYRVTSDNGRNNAYYATSLDTREKKLIATLDAGNVTYSQGHLLFMQNHTLMAQPFDLKSLATTGPPRPIASGVLLSTGSPPVFGVFSASQTGRLVYLSQGGEFNDPMTVRSDWADSPSGR
jgi:eukaryotic-like serine/threonine-protein kinase